MNSSILQEIAEHRSRYRSAERSTVELLTGGSRKSPLVPFFARSGLICELKRASPSRGRIIGDQSLEEIFSQYRRSGAHRFSVLTEREYFQGNMSDLHSLKQRSPQLAFLRKDFILTTEDITESYLIGADAVLLIAELLDSSRLEQLTAAAHDLGLQVLTEVHDISLIPALLEASPESVPDALGINSRDLRDFSVNTAVPFAAAGRYASRIPLVFESGVHETETVYHAANTGFHGVLMGEVCMRSPESLSHFIEAFTRGADDEPRLFSRLIRRYRGRPLVKICGITSREDARYAAELGADLLGCIIADSPRSIPLKRIGDFRETGVPVCAVTADPDEQILKALEAAIARGDIQGVQFHGNEPAEMLRRFGGNACKAVTHRSRSDLRHSYGPFVLYDLPKGVKSQELVRLSYREQLRRRFIAGNIRPDNLEEILEVFDPVLIDLASGVESSPGVKDRGRLKSVFTILER